MWLELLLLFPFETKRWLKRGINHTKNLRGFKGFVLNHLPVSWLEKKKTNSIKRIEWLASRESNFNTKINASSFHWSLSWEIASNLKTEKDSKIKHFVFIRLFLSIPVNHFHFMLFLALKTFDGRFKGTRHSLRKPSHRSIIKQMRPNHFNVNPSKKKHYFSSVNNAWIQAKLKQEEKGVIITFSA